MIRTLAVRYRWCGKIVTYALLCQQKMPVKILRAQRALWRHLYILYVENVSWRTRSSKQRSFKTLLLYRALSHAFPISYVITCKNDCWLIYSAPQCRSPKIGTKTTDLFRWKTNGYARKKLETLLYMVQTVRKKILIFCLQFPFN